tara:strand:- start:530 stop:1225 length:696 start_codon:yes stop_codon:yes gene_type:complete
MWQRRAVLVSVAVLGLGATGAAYRGTGAGFPSKPLTTRHDTCTANLPAELIQHGGFDMACRAVMAYGGWRTLKTYVKNYEMSVIKQSLETPACDADKEAATKRLGEMLQEILDAQDSQTTPSPGLAPSPPTLYSGISSEVSAYIGGCKNSFIEKCTIVLKDYEEEVGQALKARDFEEKGLGVFGPNKGSKDAGGGDAEETYPSQHGDMQKLGFTPKEAEPAPPPAAKMPAA